jgi:hypothetical protein
MEDAPFKGNRPAFQSVKLGRSHSDVKQAITGALGEMKDTEILHPEVPDCLVERSQFSTSLPGKSALRLSAIPKFPIRHGSNKTTCAHRLLARKSCSTCPSRSQRFPQRLQPTQLFQLQAQRTAKADAAPQNPGVRVDGATNPKFTRN